MRREDIRLLTAARQGDVPARCELGRRYLLGVPGFAQNIALGLDYLSYPATGQPIRAALIIAENLPLHEIIHVGQIPALRRSAFASSPGALFKLGVHECLINTDFSEAQLLFQKAVEVGSSAANAALAAISQRPDQAVGKMLREVNGVDGICAEILIAQALSRTNKDSGGQGSEVLLPRLLEAAASLPGKVNVDLTQAVVAALSEAQDMPSFRLVGSAKRFGEILEEAANRGQADAALLLGRALCGLTAGALNPWLLSPSQNMRKGTALLMRAADAGNQEAWLSLYRVHADHSSSAANPNMARFFLEKAAAAGDPMAQRLLGILILRSSSQLHETEQAIFWLHKAAESSDQYSEQILRSLTLSVAGSESDATKAIETIRQQDPWIACRLRTARDFGLTKQEALTVDILSGARSWGLVVGPNGFVAQSRMAAPRAVPALTHDAMGHLRRSMGFLEQSRQAGSGFDGTLRQRSVRLRRMLQNNAIDEALFFAQARSSDLETLRRGTKWAFKHRELVRLALVA